MMTHYKYLIVGGGMTADAAVKSIAKMNADGPIGVISAEPDRPYKRPPLTKALWKGAAFDTVWLKTEQQRVDLHLGRKVVAVDPRNKRVTDDHGEEYTFDKLLLVTGGTPRRFTFPGSDEVIYYRTLADYHRLHEMARQRRRFAVIGGGFIGSEIAAALAMNQQDVVMIFPEDTIGERIYPPELAQFLNDYYREKGVELLAAHSVVGVERRGERLAVRLLNRKDSAEREVLVDGVVAGIGIQPNVELAQQAGLQVDGGVVVDELLRTSHPDIYAAGDVALFYNPALDKRIRVEHEDNAYAMGGLAGRAMAGQPEPYHHLPFFYSDLFELGYEAVGELDSRLETVADWKQPYQEGVVYYLQEGRVRGVLLWNVWGQVDAARRLIAERGPIRAEELKGRLPEDGG